MALFASLEPHAPEGLLEAVAKRTLKADPVVMISNHKSLQKIARKHQVPFRHVDWSQRQQAEKGSGVDGVLPGRFHCAGAVHENSLSDLCLAFQKSDHQHPPFAIAKLSRAQCLSPSL